MELIFKVIAIKENIGYASDLERNGLFQVDVQSGECTFLQLFPDEEINIARLHEEALWIKDKVYFIPSAGKHISIFDVEDKNILNIEVPPYIRKQGDNYRPQLKFTKAIERNNILWIIPATYPGILKLNLNTYDVELINDWIPNDDYMFRRGVNVRGDIIYAASGNNNLVLVFNMETETGKIICVGNKNNGAMDMISYGADFIFAPRKAGAIVRWNPDTDEVVEFDSYPDGFIHGNVVFICAYEYNSQLIFVPAYANQAIRLVDNNLFMDSEIKWKISYKNNIDFLFETEDKRYFREIDKGLTSRIFFVNKINNELKCCNFLISNPVERMKNIVAVASENREKINELFSFGLKEWIEAL